MNFYLHSRRDLPFESLSFEKSKKGMKPTSSIWYKLQCPGGRAQPAAVSRFVCIKRENFLYEYFYRTMTLLVARSASSRVVILLVLATSNLTHRKSNGNLLSNTIHFLDFVVSIFKLSILFRRIV